MIGGIVLVNVPTNLVTLKNPSAQLFINTNLYSSNKNITNTFDQKLYLYSYPEHDQKCTRPLRI